VCVVVCVAVRVAICVAVYIAVQKEDTQVERDPACVAVNVKGDAKVALCYNVCCIVTCGVCVAMCGAV